MSGAFLLPFMKLSAPTQIFFIISLVLVILALIGHFQLIPNITPYQFWLAVSGYAVLALGCLFKGA